MEVIVCKKKSTCKNQEGRCHSLPDSFEYNCYDEEPQTPEAVVPLNDLLCGRTQDLPVAQPGEVNRPVLAIVQHWNTKGQRYAVLKAVDESDHSWQTVDDGSELSHDWNVISWIYLPDLTAT